MVENKDNIYFGGIYFDQRKGLEGVVKLLVSSLLAPGVAQLPDPPRLPDTREYLYLKNIYDLCQTYQKKGGRVMSQYSPVDRLFGDNDQEYFINRYVHEVVGSSDYIKKRRAYPLLSSLSKRVEELTRRSQNQLVITVYNRALEALYSQVCTPDRVLVSVDKRPLWRLVNLRQVTNEEFDTQWSEIITQIPRRLHELTPSMLPVIPDYFLTKDDLRNLSIPHPLTPVEDSLEEAYYRKHFIVPPEGAQVFLRNGGDLEGFVLMEKDNNIWAKAQTTKGEYIIRLNLDDATIERQELEGQGRLIPEKMNDLTRMLALVYRDLVVSEDVLSQRRSKTLRTSEETKEQEPKKYEWVYIPRKRRIKPLIRSTDKDNDQHHRSPRPHKVSGFKRKGDITAKHEIEIRDFEKETGIAILKNLPEGYTFVRPHVRPKNSLESELAKLPKFIKRKIEEDIKGPITIQL
ncbi:MAG: hypothetical protein Q8P92_03445 [Candidatus Daviesbacteria bacterium]|nr:hypothetical protein [Candidatus Daviesbacteria bacterium]